jgi:uncharacterized coiled-coil protein SlyX
MKNLDKLISEASGMSTKLDQTLLSLSAAVNEKQVNEQQAIIKALRKQVRDLNTRIDEMQVQYLNQGVTEDSINAARNAIVEQFHASGSAMFWYRDTYNKNLFELLPNPIIRVTICKELIRQSQAYPDFEIPQIWQAIVKHNGLIKGE